MGLQDAQQRHCLALQRVPVFPDSSVHVTATRESSPRVQRRKGKVERLCGLLEIDKSEVVSRRGCRKEEREAPSPVVSLRRSVESCTLGVY